MVVRMNPVRAAALLAADPVTFARKSLARLSGMLGVPSGRRMLRIGDVRFECDLALDPRVRDMYFGAYEPEEVAFLRRTLRAGDVCVDVGANIGYFTAIAAACVGPNGAVHAFEPVPEYYARLAALRVANPGHRIHTVNDALGSSEGAAQIRVTRDRNIGWNTLVPGFMAPDAARATHSVRVRRLDEYLAAAGVERVALVKLDAEGYELLVLEGLRTVLAGNARPVILCEVAPHAYPLLGRTVDELFTFMAAFGYRAARVDGHPIGSGEIHATSNIVFRPDTPGPLAGR